MNAIMIAGTFGRGAQIGSMSGEEILCASFLAVAGAMLVAAGALLTRQPEQTPAQVVVRYLRPRR